WVPVRAPQVRPWALSTTEDALTPTHGTPSSDLRRRHLHPADGVASPLAARRIVGAHLEEFQLVSKALQVPLAERPERDARQPPDLTVNGSGREDLVRLSFRRDTRRDVQTASDIAAFLVDKVTPVHRASQGWKLRLCRGTPLDLQSAQECCA